MGVVRAMAVREQLVGGGTARPRRDVVEHGHRPAERELMRGRPRSGGGEFVVRWPFESRSSLPG